MDREEAIKIVRNIYQTDAEKEALGTLIPELRESEDERIRNVLVSIVKWLGFDSSFFVANSVTKSEVLNYLEKQKSVDDKVFEEWVDDCWKHYKVNNPDSYDKGDEIQFDERGFKNFCRRIRNLYRQKPTEWSEEDEKKIHFLSRLIEFQVKDDEYCFGEGSRMISKQEAIEMLKSLRPQSKDEIYKEKNEAFKLGKHQLAIKFMNYLDENRPEGKMGLSNGECEDIDKAFKENDWAKIMRYVEKYRPSWKPSKEQISVLEFVIGNHIFGHQGHRGVLESLLFDLKKL